MRHMQFRCAVALLLALAIGAQAQSASSQSLSSSYFSSQQSGSEFNAPPPGKPSPAVLNNILNEAKKMDSGSSSDVGASMPASKLKGGCLDDDSSSCKTRVIVQKKSKFEEEYDRMVAAMSEALGPLGQMIAQIKDKSGVVHEYQAARGAVDPLLFKLKTAQKGLEQDFADSNDRFIKEIEVKATQKAFEILTEAAKKEMNLPRETDAAVEKAAIAAALEIRDQMMNNKANLHPRFVQQYEKDTLPELDRFLSGPTAQKHAAKSSGSASKVATIMRALLSKFVSKTRGGSR